MSRYALDLGTRTTRLAVGSEPPHTVPSLAAVEVDRDRVIAVGESARAEALRAGARAVLVNVIEAGTPRDPSTLEGFVRLVLREAGVRSFQHGEVVVAIGQLATSLERRMVVRALDRLGASSVLTIAPAAAAARSAGLEADTGAMALVIGEGYSEAGIVAMGNLCAGAAAKVGVRDLRAAIRDHLWSEHELAITDEVAGEVLAELCDVAEPLRSARARIWGRRRTDGEGASAIVDASALVAAMMPTLRTLEGLVHETLESAHAELVADVGQRGILLAGGGAFVPGLAARIATASRIDVLVSPDPLGAVLSGLGPTPNRTHQAQP